MAHVSKITKIGAIGDGLLAVTVRCCGDPTTDSVLTLHGLGREDALVDADIAAHQARVEQLHEARDRAKAHIERLSKR